MAQYKAAVTPLLTHWSYCSLALSHWYGPVGNSTGKMRWWQKQPFNSFIYFAEVITCLLLLRSTLWFTLSNTWWSYDTKCCAHYCRPILRGTRRSPVFFLTEARLILFYPNFWTNCRIAGDSKEWQLLSKDFSNNVFFRPFNPRFVIVKKLAKKAI